MDWTSIRKHYGIERPYDFRVALPFLLNVSGVIVVLAVCASLWMRGSLTLGTERFYFFLYILVLLTAAAALSRVSRLSLGVLSFCVLELTLALATSVQERFGRGVSTFPQDYFTEERDYRFVYHPVLQAVPRTNWQQELTFDVRNKNAERFSNWPMNWAELEGRKFRFSHNSLGIRGTELTERDLSKDLIFVYGGSTTYDTSVTQGATWVEQLQSELGEKYTVLNFGVIGYTTAHHLIQTAFYDNVRGRRPVCAVYYVGWNDLINMHKEGLDAAYADWHALRLLGAVRKPEVWPAKYSPTVRFAYKYLQKWMDSVPVPEPVHGEPIVASDARLERFFAEHIRVIAAINNSRSIRTVFIGQVLNRDYLAIRPEAAYFYAPRVRNGDIWPLQERFNSILRETASSSGAAYINAGVENFHASDFSDPGHFVAAGAKKFAHSVADAVESDCHRDL